MDDQEKEAGSNQFSIMLPENRSHSVDKLMGALAKAQGAFPDIERNRTVKVVPRSGGTAYEFKYATLSAIFHAIKGPLSANGLAYTQVMSHDPGTGFYVLTTSLFHESGQFISSPVPLILDNVNTNQQFGSALTYMKRYALAALLGIAADEDDDGNAADGNEVKAVKDKVAAPPAAPKPDPISTGTATGGFNRPSLEEILKPALERIESFIPAKIDVPLLADESGSDWMSWGQAFMAAARGAPDAASLKKLEENNSIPMKNMEISAPKMFTNMAVALIKVRKALEKTNA